MTLLHHYKSSGKIKTIILSADKESCTVILNKIDQMIEDGIIEGNYIETSDNKLCDLK